MKKWVMVGILAVMMGGCGLNKGSETSGEVGFGSRVNPITPRIPMKVGDRDIEVEVRTTDAGRALGLSTRPGLEAHTGMLFVFEQGARPQFWMKDMLFDLDMVWIDDGRIVDIDANVPAPRGEGERLATASSPVPIEAVLEVPAGYAAENGWKVGDVVQW